MDLFQEYKEMYYKELEHSDRLNSKIGNSIAFITLIGSGNLLIWQKYFSSKQDSVFLIFCIISFISFLLSIYKFYKAYSGYWYAYFPTDEMNKKIKQTFEATKEIEKGETIAKSHIQNMFELTYIDCAKRNFEQNIIKSNRHKAFTISVIISFSLLASSYAYNISIMENTHLLR